MNIDPYISDGQDPAVVEKLLLKLLDMLPSEGEEITYIAVQKKPAVTLFPNSIVLTDKRVFICKPTKLGLATDFDIVGWQQVANFSFKEGILGAQVTVAQQDGTESTVGYIPKSQARKLYKAGMEAWQACAAANEMAVIDHRSAKLLADQPVDELTEKLEKLKSLFERGLITDVEYEQKKMELLSQL